MNDRARLERIIRAKEMIHDARRGELARARHAVNDAESVLDRALAVHESVVQALSAIGDTTGEELALRAHAVARSTQSARRAHAALDERRTEEETRATATIESGRELKALETVRGRALATDRTKANAVERSLEDDRAGRRGGAR